MFVSKKDFKFFNKHLLMNSISDKNVGNEESNNKKSFNLPNAIY